MARGGQCALTWTLGGVAGAAGVGPRGSGSRRERAGESREQHVLRPQAGRPQGRDGSASCPPGATLLGLRMHLSRRRVPLARRSRDTDEEKK